VQYAEAFAVIRRIPIFRALSPGDQKLLAFSSAYLVFEAGEALFHEGDPTDSAYLVDDGLVEVCLHRGTEEIVLGQLGKNELVGEMGIIRNSPRSATVRAVGTVKVLRIDADVFLHAVTSNPDAALGVMRHLSDKIAAITQRYEAIKRHASGWEMPEIVEC
jgi:CRP-like cAMP-binding protein